ncbi:hypothetical protein PCAU_3260 [Pseudomonas chlororaphis subsp. aurantiaca]|uniref:hypothetical protein n=1 Tax=Pseudomonas chlororaphis TaxID=587753 RepID=UPI0008652170|nr:hypothetical protein [Pseudomonas chlororaphis]BAV75469.1 hypothetical protein PCAU_3260 [Pseudomonas chlororaphis subsp. aurantiaca]
MPSGIGFFLAFKMGAVHQVPAEGGSVEAPAIGPLQLLRISAGDRLAQALN